MQTLSTSINSGDINLLTRLWLRLDLQKATSLRHAYANRVQSEETKKEKNPDIFHTVQTIGWTYLHTDSLYLSIVECRLGLHQVRMT